MFLTLKPFLQMKKITYLSINLGILILFLFPFTNSNAQSLPQLFNEVSSDVVPTELVSYVNNIKAIPTVSSTKIITVANVWIMVEGNHLHFSTGLTSGNIPPILDAYTMDISINSVNDYVFKADIPSGDGGMVIVKKPSGIGGIFHYKDKYFDIYPLTEQYSVLVEHDKPYTAPECKQGSTQTSSVPMDCDSNTCAGLISMLILITPETKAWFNNNANNIAIFTTTVVEKLNKP